MGHVLTLLVLLYMSIEYICSSSLNGTSFSSATSLSQCHRQYPSQGSWTESAPYWQPSNCPLFRAFGTDEAITCLQNRTVYVVGNSVARQSAFCLVELLGGASVAREGQKELCPKHETTWGDSCHKELHQVKIRYLFLNFIDGFFYENRSG